MPVVKKVTVANIIAKKPKLQKPSVRSVRQPSSINEMGDTSFGALDSTKNGLLVAYDSNTDKFILVTPDAALTTSAEDQDISDPFVDQLEQELDFGQIQAGDIDGGGF